LISCTLARACGAAGRVTGTVYVFGLNTHPTEARKIDALGTLSIARGTTA
jgi:hypothetical protein